jgi:hypothetical protein
MCMLIDRQKLVAVLREAGLAQQIPRAERELPESVDTTADAGSWPNMA